MGYGFKTSGQHNETDHTLSISSKHGLFWFYFRAPNRCLLPATGLINSRMAHRQAALFQLIWPAAVNDNFGLRSVRPGRTNFGHPPFPDHPR